MNPAPSFPPPMQQPPPPGWWSRNWKWCVPASVVSLIVLFVGFILMILSLVFGMLKSSDPYKESLARAKANPQVQAALGTPVSSSFFVSGNINLNNDSGNASLGIPISGPKGKGSIKVVATKSAGAWSYSTMEVGIDGKPDRIDLKP